MLTIRSLIIGDERMKTALYSILMKTYHAQRARIRPYMNDIGLSAGQPKILNYLVAHPKCSQKEIALGCDIEPATVSKLLDTMEMQGLVERRKTQSDRRSFAIVISERGELAQKTWRAHCLDVEADALHDFSEEEKEQLRKYLCRMYKNLTKRDLE